MLLHIKKAVWISPKSIRVIKTYKSSIWVKGKEKQVVLLMT